MNSNSQSKSVQAGQNNICTTIVNRFLNPKKDNHMKSSQMNPKNSVFFATKFLLLLFVFVGAQLFPMQSASAQAQPYTNLPLEVAEEMKWMAYHAAWAAADQRFGRQTDSTGHQIDFKNHAEAMQNKAVGLEGISKSTLDDIMWFAWNAAWYPANSRAADKYVLPADREYWRKEANKSMTNANTHLDRVKNSGQLAPALVQSINDMVWAVAWFTTNSKVYGADHAKLDWAAFESAHRKIPGVVKFVRVVVGTVVQEGVAVAIVNRTPPYLNCGEQPQSEEYTETTMTGSTVGWSHTVGFEFGVTAGVNVEVTLKVVSAGVSVGVSKKESYNTTWYSEKTYEQTTSVKKPFIVQGFTTKIYEEVIHQAKLKAPYDIIYEIEGKQYKVHGDWQVEAVSQRKPSWGPDVRINPATYQPCIDLAKATLGKASSTNDEVNIAAPTEATTALVETNRIFLPLIANTGAVTDEGNVMTKTEATTEPATDERNDTVVTAATLELGSTEANGTLTAETMTDVASAELNLTAATETLVGGTESNRIYLPLIANDNL